MIGYVLLLLAGIILSAFFSGSETGFYRVAKLRLRLDAGDGHPVARGLLFLTNNPGLFVATASKSIFHLRLKYPHSVVNLY